MLKFFLSSLFLASMSAFAVVQSGQPAPDFSLKGADGKSYKLSQFNDKVVVLEWFNQDCPYVRKFYKSKVMQDLQGKAVKKGVVWLSIISSAQGKEGHVTAAAATQYRKEKGVQNTAILFDASGEVGKLYGAKTTPHMFIVNKGGQLVYQGAIDDRPSANPETLKGASNYVSRALDSLDKGESIAEDSTVPYGCSIKY